MKKIKKFFSDYERWTFSFDEPMSMIAIISPIAIFVAAIIFSFAGMLNHHAKNECLDSLLPRRYHSFVCEERFNDEWIKVVSSNEKIYYYNEPASR